VFSIKLVFFTTVFLSVVHVVFRGVTRVSQQYKQVRLTLFDISFNIKEGFETVFGMCIHPCERVHIQVYE